MSLVEVAGDKRLSRNPVSLVFLLPLEFELSDLDEVTSSSFSLEVLPLNVDRGASNILISGHRRVHGGGAANNLLSNFVFRRELVRSAMFVEASDHNLDGISFLESSEALDGSISISDRVEHGNRALAGLDDLGILSKAVLLEFEPRSVLLLENNLVS